MTDNSEQSKTVTDSRPQPAEAGKRPYEAPRVLSAEPLEAAAATCDPPTGAFGKSVPIPCSTVGS